MLINNPDLNSFTIKRLLTNGDVYIIPVYQRNYEWGKEQIEQLLMDIKDYFSEERGKNYYIGTLIVDKLSNRQNHYETIDGQQRLTTLNILCCAMKELQIDITDVFSQPIIRFESRKNADETIRYIYENGSKEEPKFLKYNVGIFDGIKYAVEILKKIKNELQHEFEAFIRYFFENVHILRVQVPEDTDMNHYFEIMNSRGEQLEKHEILKARLMKELNVSENSFYLRKQFNYIWESCADIFTNIQLHFSKEFRRNLFGKNWYHFTPKNQEELFKISFFNDGDESVGKRDEITFTEILNEQKSINDIVHEMYDLLTINESEGEQFQPIISFENFLLHVLKIQEADLEINLDDKRLLLFFEKALENKEDKVLFVKTFTYNLLRIRFLLDQYIVRRKYTNGSDYWSLQCIKFYEKNDTRETDSYSYVNTFIEDTDTDQLIKLLSMFHVSTPTQIYKYWLLATLNHLNENMVFEEEQNDKPNHISSKQYADFLENTAKRFMLYRFLSKDKPQEYNDIIFNTRELPEVKPFKFEDKLSYGNIENNLVFNYTDYLLWKNDPVTFKEFEVSFRSSVEHYYPQHPITGEFLNTTLKKENNIILNSKRMYPLDFLNCYGNLCLISHNNNSRLSNHMPRAKKDYYIQAKTKDSIKQFVMMDEASFPSWGADEIFVHHNDMIELLNSNLF